MSLYTHPIVSSFFYILSQNVSIVDDFLGTYPKAMPITLKPLDHYVVSLIIV